MKSENFLYGRKKVRQNLVCFGKSLYLCIRFRSFFGLEAYIEGVL